MQLLFPRPAKSVRAFLKWLIPRRVALPFRRGVDPKNVLMASAVALGLGFAAATGLLVMHLRIHALIEGGSEIRGLSLLLADQAERAFEAVELSGASFTSFVLDQDHDGKSSRRSFVLRGYVKTWLEQVWDNFEAAGINNLIAVRNQKKIASAQNHKHHNKKQRGDQGNERFQAR